MAGEIAKITQTSRNDDASGFIDLVALGAAEQADGAHRAFDAFFIDILGIEPCLQVAMVGFIIGNQAIETLRRTDVQVRRR